MTDDTRSQDPATVIERVLEARAEVIWQMWTDPRHFSAWYGPDGATVSVVTMDVRIGGARHIRMEAATPQGPMTMWFAGEHVEVAVNERLAYTESMSDENADIISPAVLGMPPGHPTTTTVIVQLNDLGARTKMTLTHVGVPQDSPGATGWTMAIDKLAARVAAADTF